MLPWSSWLWRPPYTRKVVSSILTGSIHLYICPRGPTDKASDYESGDCGFESHRGCIFVVVDWNRNLTYVGCKNQKGPTGTWTRIAGFRVQSDNHYTIGPKTTCITPGGTRTHNLTLRRGAPYPLGHRGIGLKCSRRGSNPRPSAHKTNALPLSYGSDNTCKSMFIE